MLNLPLTATERGVFNETLRSSHTRRTRVEILDLNEGFEFDVSDRLLSGEVNVDADADITRSLRLSLLDPSNNLNFDTQSPNNGALFLDRMVRVTILVYVPLLADYVEVPVFLGPINKLDRRSDVLEVESQGKEALSRRSAWNVMEVRANTPVISAVRTIMEDRGGEEKFNLESSITSRLGKKIAVGKFSDIWDVAKAAVSDNTSGKQLFYDATGTLVLRTTPESPIWTFRSGEGGDVTTPVAITYDSAEVRNAIEVKGKKNYKGSAVADDTHPLSPYNLRVNGVRRYIGEQIDTELNSNAKCAARARSVLDSRLRKAVQVQFDALPIPHLEPGDVVAVEYEGYRAEFVLDRFTIPLTTEGSPAMSVGYTAPSKKDYGSIR